MASPEDRLSPEQKDQILFFSLVQNFQQTAWVGLGKLADPSSNETKIELEMAQYAIDMLAMLQRRTEGNLDDSEAKSLREILHALRMNYVDVMRQEQTGSGEGAESGASESQEAADDATEAEGSRSDEAQGSEKAE